MAAFGKQCYVLLLLASCVGCAGPGTRPFKPPAMAKAEKPFANHRLNQEPVVLATNVARPVEAVPQPQPIHRDPQVMPAAFEQPSPAPIRPAEPSNGVVFVNPNPVPPIPAPPPQEPLSPLQPMAGPATTWITPGKEEPIAEAEAEEASQAVEVEAEATEVRPTKELQLRNLCFCREIDSYGVYQRFESTQFRPGQEVLLYVEVEGFQSEAKPAGYCTALSSSWEIQDDQGRRQVQRTYPAAEDICRNQRRDFFQAYRFRLPKLVHGAYELILEVHDTLSEQTARANIPFQVKAQK